MLIQQYIPIISRESKKVLGMYNLGANLTFTGNETTHVLAAGNISIEKWQPTSSIIRPVNPAFMASVWNHEGVRLKYYQGFSEFVPLKNVLPSTTIHSGSGLANLFREYKGALLAGLAESFGVGLANLVPLNTVAPSLSGVPTSGNILTCSNGTWLNVPVTYIFQWFKDNVAIPGANAATHLIVAGDVGHALSCTVWTTNLYGQSKPAFSNVITPAS